MLHIQKEKRTETSHMCDLCDKQSKCGVMVQMSTSARDVLYSAILLQWNTLALVPSLFDIRLTKMSMLFDSSKVT